MFVFRAFAMAFQVMKVLDVRGSALVLDLADRGRVQVPFLLATDTGGFCHMGVGGGGLGLRLLGVGVMGMRVCVLVCAVCERVKVPLAILV